MLEGCQIIGRDWRYSYVNAAAARHGRRTAEELLGHTMMEAYPGIQKTEVFGALRRCMEDRKPCRMENEFTFPDGSTALFELSIQPVPEGVLVLSYDITERKQAERALSESERRYRHLVETTRIIAWEADCATWRFTHRVGGWAEEVLGYPLTDWFKDGFWVDRIHPEDREAATKHCAERASQDDDFELEYRMVRADGGTVWFHDIVHVVRGANGPETIKGFLIDITERKHSEDAVRESEALKQDVLNSLPAHIAVLDRDGTIIAINEAWERFARENSDSVVPRTGLGTNYFDVCRKATAEAAPDADKALAGIRSVLDGSQESFSTEYACHSPVTERWFLMSVTPLSALVAAPSFPYGHHRPKAGRTGAQPPGGYCRVERGRDHRQNLGRNDHRLEQGGRSHVGLFGR
jgi:PAS domain S-box-containing protein